jgi:hypothetical protein
MKSSELRNLIREEIKTALKEAGADMSFLDKVGGSVRSKLGTGKTQLNRALDMIDTERLAKLPVAQKIDLMVALIDRFGIDAKSFNQVKARVAKQLGSGSTATTMESKQPKKK